MAAPGKFTLVTKSKFAIAKEAEAERKKKEAEAAAAVFATFAESFADDGPAAKPATSAWVRGGVIQHGAGELDTKSIADGPGARSELYVLDAKGSGARSGSSASGPGTSPVDHKTRVQMEAERLRRELEGREAPPELPSLSAAAGGSGGTGTGSGSGSGTGSGVEAATIIPVSANPRRREMDAFLEELKQKQENGGGGRGRSDSDVGRHMLPSAAAEADTATTNIYVSNLGPTVTEEQLAAKFKQYGRISSVKVMWPRTDEERARGKNTGFVCFERREDAEAAIRGMQDVLVAGHAIRVGWAKAVRSNTVPTASFPAPPTQLSASSSPAPPAAPAPSASTLAALQAMAAKISSSVLARGGPVEVPATALPASLDDVLDIPPASVSAPAAAAVAPVPVAPVPPVAPPLPFGALQLPQPPQPPQLPQPPQMLMPPATMSSPHAPRPPLLPLLPPAVPALLPSATAHPSTAPALPPVYVQIPADRRVRKLIDLWCQYVIVDGQPLENIVMQKERERAVAAASSSSAAAAAAYFGVGPDEAEAAQAGPRREFDFFFVPDSDDAQYYRWKVWSLLQGDTPSRWRTAPCQFQEGGSVWHPPPCPAATRQHTGDANEIAIDGEADEEDSDDEGLLDEENGDDDEDEDGAADGGRDGSGRRGGYSRGRRGGSRARRRGQYGNSDEPDNDDGSHGQGGWRWSRRRSRSPNRRSGSSSHTLTDKQRTQWQQLLTDLDLSRARIADAMLFALDHAGAASELVEAVTALMRAAEQEQHAAAQVARLYLLSDLLANSAQPGVHNASAFRTLAQAALPDAFEALAASFRCVSGRISREGMRDRVMRTLAAWERASIFTPLYCSGLEATFVRRPEDEDEEAWQRCADAELTDEELHRKARAAGISCAGTRRDILQRLAWLNAHIKMKLGVGLGAMGSHSFSGMASNSTTAAPAPSSAPAPTNSSGSGSGSGSAAPAPAAAGLSLLSIITGGHNPLKDYPSASATTAAAEADAWRMLDSTSGSGGASAPTFTAGSVLGVSAIQLHAMPSASSAGAAAGMASTGGGSGGGGGGGSGSGSGAASGRKRSRWDDDEE